MELFLFYQVYFNKGGRKLRKASKNSSIKAKAYFDFSEVSG